MFRRRLFTLFAAASLTLCAAVCVIWILSYNARYWLSLRSGPVERAMDTGGSTWPKCRTCCALSACNGGLGLEFYSPEWIWGNWLFPETDFSIVGPFVFEKWTNQRLRRYPVTNNRSGSRNLGFLIDSATSTDGERDVTTFFFTVPCWSVLLLLMLLPAYRFRAFASAGPRGDGKCASCGYDLRATPKRCPECGRRVMLTGALKQVIATATTSVVILISVGGCVRQPSPSTSRRLPPPPTTLPVEGVVDPALIADYYVGDGTGYNILMTLGGDGRFSCKWVGCLGVYGRASGMWNRAGGRVTFVSDEATGSLHGYLRGASVVNGIDSPALVLDQDLEFYRSNGLSRFSALQRQTSPAPIRIE